MGLQQLSVRDRLIRVGLDELNKNGLQDFSLRHVATVCGVSCAAPYKYFQDKNDLIAAIIKYANDLFALQQQKIIKEHPHSYREQILFICRDYIEFLIKNPYIRSALMTKDAEFDSDYLKLKSSISKVTHQIVEQYCSEVNMPPNVSKIKLFVVRSIIYGAALMIDNGEIENTPEIMDSIIKMIDREFDLP